MNKVRDEAAEDYPNIEFGNNGSFEDDAIVVRAYKQGWDKCLRSEPRVWALRTALEKIAALSGMEVRHEMQPKTIAERALAAFKEGQE